MRAAGRDEGHGQRGGFDEVSSGDVVVHNLRAFAGWIGEKLNIFLAMKRPDSVTLFDDIAFAALRVEWQTIS
jgi:hypothetical protein